jgi:glycosyltransferase involved in cell wall biosynthesis
LSPAPAARSFTILHTESSLGWGGQERRILAEAVALRQRGHRLHFACDPDGELFLRARRQDFAVLSLKFGGWRNLKAWMTLGRFLRQQKVDILNTHSSLDSWVGLLAWKFLTAPPLLVRTRHLSTPVKGSWPTRRLYQAPAAIITTGEATKELLQSRLGVPESRIFSIPTGVSLTEFAPQEADGALRARLQIPPQAFILGTVAVLRSWKGHLYLLEALQELLSRDPDVFLVVVGDGPYQVVIKEKIQALGVQDRVRLAGYQDKVAPWLALMDAVVLASYANEGVPQALLQAMAMGKPVVGTTVGGIPEVVVHEETGLLVPPRDSQALAQALGRLMAQPHLGRQLGGRGRDLVAAKFSLEQMAAAVEAVYLQAWEQGRGGGSGP